MAIVSVSTWNWVLEEVMDLRGVVFLLGTTDSGKSTLARYILRELTCRGQTPALVDADIGQSSLGLPGTVAMTIFRAPASPTGYAKNQKGLFPLGKQFFSSKVVVYLQNRAARQKQV